MLAAKEDGTARSQGASKEDGTTRSHGAANTNGTANNHRSSDDMWQAKHIGTAVAMLHSVTAAWCCKGQPHGKWYSRTWCLLELSTWDSKL